MADLETIKQSARIVYDEQGTPVVQLPLEQWQELIADVEGTAELPQHVRIQALLKQWEQEPDNTPEEWWEQFDAFMRENPVTFGDPDTIFGDE